MMSEVVEREGDLTETDRVKLPRLVIEMDTNYESTYFSTLNSTHNGLYQC